MCGRYTLITPERILAERFSVQTIPPWSPRYNLGPAQEGLIVRCDADGGQRTAARLRWGLIPHWAHDATRLPAMINARSETAAEKPAFRDSFRRRRCLVLTDGFVEWSRRSGEKRPYLFNLADGRTFAMAGLWDSWIPHPGPGDDPPHPRETFTILTTGANSVMESYHDRMPVIMDDDAWDTWLDPYLVAPGPLKKMLDPFPSSRIRVHPINPRINNIRHDDPSCLDPPPPPDPKPPATDQLDMGF